MLWLVKIGGGVRAALAWAGRNPDIVIILVALAVILTLRAGLKDARADADRQEAIAAQWKSDFLKQREEMRKFTDLVRQARLDAARDDEANRKRVEREWSAKLEKQSHDYQSSLAAALAGVDRRMRSGSAEGGSGVAGGGSDAELPRLSILPDGPLPASGVAIISKADALICAANTVRLGALIAAWSNVAAIDVNGAIKKAP